MTNHGAPANEPAEDKKSGRALKFLLASDFNLHNLAALLLKRETGFALDITTAPFGRVMQLLLSREPSTWLADLDGTLLWTSPEAISPTYGKALCYEDFSTESVLGEVDEFAHALTSILPHVRHIFVPTWSSCHALDTRRGLLDMHPRLGITALLMKMNLRLAEVTLRDSRVHLFDSMRWIASQGDRAYDARLWYLSKTPFAIGVFREAAQDLVAALRAIQGKSRKLVILDLDDTLWGGVVGDVGWRNLRIGGHDPIGEAYRDFQLGLRGLTRRGILLAIVSKNQEHIALEAIHSHPDMALKLEDFAAWRINWEDKAANVAELAAELNLSLDSAVFLDDNRAERARVRQALPSVLVPEWPNNPIDFPRALRALDCFDAPVVSDEDRNRTAMYASERKRRELRTTLVSIDEWLMTLKVAVSVEILDDANLERAVQLLNKTNQMNLRTRRLSSREFRAWSTTPDNCVLIFRIADKFGDYGLAGIGSLHFDRSSHHASVEDFVLSCRVMGRKVENAMLHVLCKCARAAGMKDLFANPAPTEKNLPCQQFFEAAVKRAALSGAGFCWNLSTDFPLPASLGLSWPGMRSAESIRAISSDRAQQDTHDG
ncbi:MAG: HAD-IIIC family phosphatase [Candidatus Binataceae bacterium]